MILKILYLLAAVSNCGTLILEITGGKDKVRIITTLISAICFGFLFVSSIL